MTESSAVPAFKAYYSYEAIVKKWQSYLVWKGVSKTLAAGLLKQEALIKGSAMAKDDPIWGVSHVFYDGVLTKNAERNLYFSDQDIETLLDIVVVNQSDLDRKLLYPNPSRKIKAEEFATVQPIQFKTAAELQANRQGLRLTHNASLLKQNRAKFTEFQENAKGAIMAIDIESWERDHSILTEIGWSYIQWSPAEGNQLMEVKACEHIIIAENSGYRNGQYSPDNRAYFNFGQSARLTRFRAVKRLFDLIAKFTCLGPLILVFHNASAEIEYFATLGLDTSGWNHGFPLVDKDQDAEAAENVRLADGGVYIMDTQKLFAASGLKEAIPQIKLANALNALGIPSRRMHNAGNDACYTLAVYEALVGPGAIRDSLVAEEAVRQTEQARKPHRRTSGWGSGWD